ncbi:alpha/beta fold hydrolase [Tropicibacter sp. S64]|uniref:alpha/beta fold hydrolase n=1 Tax=Tropicibacter sp. S64 TaxID=3415122 RepID=UPI003C7D43B2
MTTLEAPAIGLRSFGDGAGRMLALHCGLGSGTMWKGVAAHLPGFTLTAPDLPGHGRSAAFRDGPDVHDQATAAVRPLMCDDLHLVGHSFGATVALRLALETPERVAALTLIEPVFFAAAEGREGVEAHREREEAFFAVFQTGDHAAAARCFNAIWGGGIPWDSFPAAVQEGMALGMPFVAATEPSLWRDSHGLLAPGRLEALRCPVTLIRGEQTVPIIEQVHAGLMERLPDARDVVVPGAGHMLVLTHAEAVARGISGL